MSDKEIKILTTLGQALTECDDFSKGYLLGFGEAIVSGKAKAKEEEPEEEKK